MNFTEQFKRLYPLFIAECKVGLPALGKIVAYLLQLMFCTLAIIVVEGWKLLLRLGDEVEKMQKKPVVAKKQTTRYNCAFVEGVTCTTGCISWVRNRGGSGYCKKLRERK
jgi:hypothetical protein